MTKDITDYLQLPEEAKPFVEKLRALWEYSEREMRGGEFKTKSDLRLIILLQLQAAASRLLHSILAQIDNNSFYGLDLLQRPLTEALINYKYIKEDLTQMRARAFIMDDHTSRIKMLKRLIPLLEKNAAPAMAQISSIEQYKKLLAQLSQEKFKFEEKFGRDNLNFLTLVNRAEIAGVSELYATAYWLFCQDTHLTSRGLDRFMSINDQQISVTFDLDLNRFIMSLRTFYIGYKSFLNECYEEFGIPNKNTLVKFPHII